MGYPIETLSPVAEPASLIAEVQRAIIPEAVDTIWDAVYREAAVGTLQIEDVEFNRTSVADVKWETASDTLESIRGSDDAQTHASLSYNFQNGDSARLTATVTSPIPIERIRLITLPVRGDASYHRLSLTVSVEDMTYEPTRPFVLESALWKNAAWRLQGIPGELESSHIPMHQTGARSQSTPASALQTLKLELTLSQPPYLAIVWDKFTSNYRNLWENGAVQSVFYQQHFHRDCINAAHAILLFTRRLCVCQIPVPRTKDFVWDSACLDDGAVSGAARAAVRTHV